MTRKGTFAARVGEFVVNSKTKVEQTRRAICIKLFSSVILDTPVDTGRLRGNWQTSVENPASQEIERLDPQGVAALQEMKENLGDGEVTVYFVNHLPYAARIEYEGWSHTKAPEGMVRKNVARINALVQQAIKEGKL